jgi:hypothetical protein
MAALTNFAAQSYLDNLTGKAAAFSNAARYLALFTAVGTDANTGFTEVSGTSYARIQIPTASWGSATGTAPSSSTTTAGVSFVTSGGDWTGAGASPIIAWGLFDALTTGNLLCWDYLGNFNWLPATVSSASPGVFTAKAHGFAQFDPVVFSTEFGGVAPTTSAGVVTGLLSVGASPTTDTFTVGSGATFTNAVLGAGTTVNTSATGNGMVRKVSAQLVPNNTTVTFNSGNIVVSLA